MRKKKSTAGKSEPVTKEFLKEFLAEQIDKVLGVVKQQGTYLESKIDQTRKLLESKIDFVRQDAKEQLQSVAEGLNKRMDGLDNRIDGLDNRMGGLDNRMDGLNNRMDSLGKRMDVMHSELKSTQLAVREVKGDVLRIESKLDPLIEKVEKHDKEIARLNL